MSGIPSESQPREPLEGESGGHSLGGGGAGSKQLTSQELREQRLARFGGGSSTPKGQAKKILPKSAPRMKGVHPADKISKPQPIYTDSTPKNKRSVTGFANESCTKPSMTAEETTPIPSQNRIEPFVASKGDNYKREDDQTVKHSNIRSNIKDNKTLDSDSIVSFDTDQLALLMQEEEDLQRAIAMSMGAPIPSSTGPMNCGDIDPLPVSDGITEGKQSQTTISNDMLATAAMVVATAPATTTPITPTTPMQIDEENHDVVMKNEDRESPMVESKANADPTTAPASPSRICLKDPRHLSGRVLTWYMTAAPFNVLDFHDCMWDKDVTVEHDQKRWLAQGIQFKHEHGDGNTSSTRVAAGTLTATNETTDTSSLLAAIISGPGVWCLTQQHGGPCGVLASIQAELLAILLFGPRTVHPLSMISIDFPTSLSTEFTMAAPDMSRSKMRQVLALSMGMILARASLKPSAALEDDTNRENRNNENVDAKENDSHPMCLSRPEPTVTLILPKNELWKTTSHLEWEHLEPWNDKEGGGGLSEHLLKYTISLNKNPSTGEIDKTAVKRQKHNSDIDMDETCRELAHATAEFLLETNSLDWFQRSGGVLLMVMSLAASRGIPMLQGDMDDVTRKLTTRFGYCSQELINLLLAGQGVSNVFDHTQRLSEEMVFRGIQSQPSIGYLTQVEATGHLEVGGFYKTPRFPVWVIGSTSHFSVMFGDGSALKESTSDVLLDKVRRAFKRMGGGAAENGVMQSNQLGEFFKNVGLNNISDNEVQMLAAFMDRFGQGIILWDDLWKRTSRLLTGASIGSILDGTDDTHDCNRSSSNASAVTGDSNAATIHVPTRDRPLSDEELARKLQAEWNGTSIENVASPFPKPSVTKGKNDIPVAREKFGRTFQLYHYNGLRGGYFKPFRVTRLSADEAIGASISLGGSNQMSFGAGGFEEGLDSVLRTKWPDCKINWLGGSPPSIH